MNKSIFLILGVLLFTSPAMAALSVSCSTAGATVTVAYNAGGGALPRAFALDVSLSGGATFVSDPCAFNTEFYIYPGSITITGGSVSDWGSPVATGGAGNSTMTIEMGSLWASDDTDHPAAPPNTANLFSFTASGTDTSTVTINENAARGGVKMEDGSDDGLGSPVCTCAVVTECFPSCHPDYSVWKSVGSPACWCCPRQCHGDADCLCQGKNGYCVSTDDLAIVASAWNKPLGSLIGNDICADFDHDSQGKQSYRVSTNDLAIMVGYWNMPMGSVPEDCLACP